MNRRSALYLFAGSLFISNSKQASGSVQTPGCAHIEWVAHILERIETVKPGMTRGDLLRIFATEGGLSTRLQCTFVSQDCPYFKVDVRFRGVGPAIRDKEGRILPLEDKQDEIVSISPPYLAFSVMD